MLENINTSPLAAPESAQTFDSLDAPTIVKVDHVSMVFNMASEQLNSLKEYVIAFIRHELMFKEFKALDDVSFEVKKGDVFGILGTNGSGKSTMLKVIAGVLDPTEGTCTTNGNIAPLIELGAGFDLELTARENVYLNGSLLGYSRKFINQHFDEIVDFAEIEEFLDMPMKNYSSGMVARIAFAIATVIVPEILIVDEVLSVGDFMFQQKCERRITQLIKNYDVTVLIVSHNNEQVERLCNKAIWIEKGHTRMLGSAEDVCRTYRILGGHVGSAESERQVFSTLNAKVDDADKLENIYETIGGESRYGIAAKLVEKCGFSTGQVAIIAPGEQASPCMAAIGLSGILDAPTLLSKPNALPDVAAQELKRLKPQGIIVVGSEDVLSSRVVSDAYDACSHETRIVRIPGTTPTEIALEIYRLGLQLEQAADDQDALLSALERSTSNLNETRSHQGTTHATPARTWGHTALITYDGCTGDLISFSPFLFQKKAPVFFVPEHGTVGQAIESILLSGAFKHILVLGGEAHIPNAFIEACETVGIRAERICGKDPYDANEMINDRMVSNELGYDNIAIERLIVTSVWNPFDAFTAGAYAVKTHSAFLLEDPQDLNSVAHALTYIKKKQGTVKHLTFLCDEMRFGDLDKELLAKAVALAPSS